MVRASVVGTSRLSSPGVALYGCADKGGLAVEVVNVVRGEVAAGVAFVAMSENGGASSWGTS